MAGSELEREQWSDDPCAQWMAGRVRMGSGASSAPCTISHKTLLVVREHLEVLATSGNGCGGRILTLSTGKDLFVSDGDVGATVAWDCNQVQLWTKVRLLCMNTTAAQLKRLCCTHSPIHAPIAGGWGSPLSM